MSSRIVNACKRIYFPDPTAQIDSSLKSKRDNVLLMFKICIISPHQRRLAHGAQPQTPFAKDLYLTNEKNG